jgi:hypothetical protein
MINFFRATASSENSREKHELRFARTLLSHRPENFPGSRWSWRFLEKWLQLIGLDVNEELQASSSIACLLHKTTLSV